MTAKLTRRLGAAAALWGAAEACLFFIAPDVVIGWIALTRGVRAASLAALLASLGAVAGGSVLWMWSDHAPAAALSAVAAVPAVSGAMIQKARADIARDGWPRAATGGSARGTPFKVYVALAPGAGVGLPALAALTLPVRLPRFLLVGAALAILGLILRPRLAPRRLALIYSAGWAGFYLWFFTSHPG